MCTPLSKLKAEIYTAFEHRMMLFAAKRKVLEADLHVLPPFLDLLCHCEYFM